MRKDPNVNIDSKSPIQNIKLPNNSNLTENLHGIHDDMLIHMYKDTPIFVDFLNINDANTSFFESMKTSDSLKTEKCIINILIIDEREKPK